MQEAWQLRAQFARRLSDLYGQAVPTYSTLVEVARGVNADVVASLGEKAQRLGSIERVEVEGHAAVRLGSPAEFAQAARIFAALGMFPTGFYDLREASAGAVPVVSTVFRPNDPVELDRNPFRVFASLLTTSDRQFFGSDLATRIASFVGARELFGPRLLALADRATAQAGLEDAEAQEFLGLAAQTFALSGEPINLAWYQELAAVSSVAADIAGISSTHLNHFAPRVLDIDAFYARMGERGIEMIGQIQGPPRWDGPDVLVRQASFRAVAESRDFVDADGRVAAGALRVRFGEVESRGIALTRLGRQVYDAFGGPFALPDTEEGLAGAGFGVFTMAAVPDRIRDGRPPAGDLSSLIAAGWLVAEPVVYEDFLPTSAAGIFQSNLTSGRGRRARHTEQRGPEMDADWLAGALQSELLDPDELYWLRSTVSEQVALSELGIRRG
jgi:uncharacterized glyoxalase superfamily metalloenzyme YdcJ